ncbi:MAG: thermonuclease family protein [Elusimicrobia bacterium]|nr:thermonuclease family protein [Elusimicrobiota bacterium]
MSLGRAAAWLGVILTVVLAAGTQRRGRAEGPETQRDAADELFDLLQRKVKDPKTGEEWLNRRFPNREWLEEIREPESDPPSQAPPRDDRPLPAEGLVEKASDGDTLKIKGVGDVRLAGVDTTEKLHPTKPVEFLAEEASRFTRELVEGQVVRLEYTPERFDKYGRALAYVYLPDGRMLNAELVRAGMAFVYTRYPFKHEKEFIELEAEASRREVGLWASEGLAEYQWLRSQGRDEFALFGMSTSLWGVRYKGMVRLRLTWAQLALEVLSLRKDAHTFGPRDLERRLEKRGYKKIPGRAS